MASRGVNVLGGVLRGLGGHMQRSAEQERVDTETRRREAVARAREMRQGMQRNAERQQDQDFRAEQAEIQRGFTADQNQLNRDAQAARSNRTTPADTGFSAGDKRLLDEAREHGTTKGLNGEAVDNDKIAQYLTNAGRPELAALYASGSDGTEIDQEDPLWQEALQYADERVGEMAGWFSRDKTDFKDYGGSRTEARRRLAEQYFVDRKSGNVGSDAETAPAEQSARAAESTSLPSGDGTQDRPYRPQTQAEFDALPSGSIFLNPSDGVLRRKN